MAAATELSALPAPLQASVPAPLLPQPWRVSAATRETDDVVTLTLEPHAGGTAATLAWQPGQFNMLYIPGNGEVPISLSGGTATAMQHTIRAVGAVTRALVASRPGSLVGVRGPFGMPWPLPASRGGDLVLVAGGIGLAPLRPVIEAVVAARSDWRRVTVLYGARMPADILFTVDHARWRAAGIDFEQTVDHAPADWRGHVGVVTALVRRCEIDPPQTQALLCGPEIMMRFTTEALLRAGMAADTIHVSLERNMHCGIGQCGHCQLGPLFVCRDGPVVPWSTAAPLLAVRGL